MIPTAQDFLRGNDENSPWTGDMEDAMIEFAKLHVKAALEQAADNAIAKENPADYGTGEIWVDRKSIINSYPLDNIR